MDTVKTTEILKMAFPDGPGAFEPGFLEVNTESADTSEEALRRFAEFGGEGWIQLAGRKDIMTFGNGSPFPVAEDWPVQGEAVLGERSLSLFARSGRWFLAYITKTAPRNDGDLLLASEFRRRDGGGTLRYETSWTKQDVFGQQEIRPAAFRFTGFSGGTGEVRS